MRIAPGCRKAGVAVTGGDIEHLFAGADVGRLAQRLADNLQRGSDHGVVAGGPGCLLLLLDGGEVWARGSSCLSLHLFVSLVWLGDPPRIAESYDATREPEPAVEAV